MSKTSDLKRKRSLPDVVREQIRSAILEGRLRPGTRLGQVDLAAQFGISRIPVREALRQLATEGLVVIEPDVGAKVASLPIGDLLDLYMLREQLEPLAVQLSTPELTDTQIATLRTHLQSLRDTAARGAPEEWLTIDRSFHAGSYAAVPSQRLHDLINGFWDRTEQYRRTYASLPQGLELANLEHALIFDALNRRDSPGAALLVTAHIRRTRSALIASSRSTVDHQSDRIRMEPAHRQRK